ncbi:MAG: 6-oxocyclohex-1-ene-1-carbonyl-CoA hydratase [Acidobacteria bacterium]|uniref:6-oxocyclohex-1-ene-1-carbonyl-CoA hydratase n=1 Tax=Candidatus Polarisedimenticola svalbardensis TaxID=2886004 RepID=A0A8J6XYX2_9BACT|nr:6-oxocyclohex-1-ene-1-carbonyl-CoA hydratase [Candidatus Polarisedimenticola svalbardensis]
MKDHNLVESLPEKEILVERKPVLDHAGQPVEGLHNLWVTLNNPKQYNSYTTSMVKELILAIRGAANDRAAVALVLTGAGDKAFCTGGNTREYAEYYAGRPLEYRQYMRLFNDMVTAVLHCDKPVVCRVNGMRVGGGQEIGMACDYSVASDLAMFSQAGPKHGSAPDGGSTDFLPGMIGMEMGMVSGTLCEPWSAHKFFRLGGLTQIVPALKVDGEWTPNPMAVTDRMLDEYGRPVLGEYKTGAQRKAAKELLSRGTVDLSLLDKEVDALCTKLLYTMPDCLIKTVESLRKHKLQHWDRNRETNRAWLSLNMMTEGKAGFRAFAFGDKETGREADFITLRRRLAEGTPWSEELIREIAPWAVVE